MRTTSTGGTLVDTGKREGIRPGLAAGRLVVMAGVLGGLFAVRGIAQDASKAPDFDLSIVAPESVEGAALSTAVFEAAVYLESRSVDSGEDSGAQGWTLSVTASEGAWIKEATTAGTAGDAPPAGYFSEGFKLVEATTGAGNLGVVSAVALSFFDPVTLPPDSREVLLKFSVEAGIPGAGAGCLPVWLEFEDGLQGQGLPVNNTITYRGQTRKDDGSSKDVDRDQEEDALVWICAPQVFLRGDCSPDGDVDLSDAILVLNYLFLGGDEPTCLSACDANDDEVVDIADPIFELQHLFLGGEAMPEPYPECGKESTRGPISCVETDC